MERIMTAKILIVEDELNLAKLMQDYLKREGYDTFIIDDGAKVLDYLQNQIPDVILLDIMLPNKDGISLCREIRMKSEVPIIMTTARVDEIDRILGLEIGANDYVCKPYSPRELVARVKVQLRSKQKDSSIENIELNPHNLMVEFQQKTIELTTVEFHLLKRLFGSQGRIFNRDQLMDAIYSDGRIVSDRTIDSHVKKIRKKLSYLSTEFEFIHSIYGCGYKFEKVKV